MTLPPEPSKFKTCRDQVPKRLRIYFRFERRLLGELCLPAEASAQAGRAMARAVITVYRAASGRPAAVPGMVSSISLRAGDRQKVQLESKRLPVTNVADLFPAAALAG